MNDQAVAVVEESEVAITPVELSSEDVKKYIAPNATDKELYMFMNIAKSYNLNPFKREVHFIKYGQQPGQVIVGYEMYLKRAERTGKLNGWDVSIEDKEKPTERAIITIYRKDRDKPFVWEVFRSEFDKKQSVWKQMPQFMLRKVAIAQGFRLAFPEDVGGMPYIPEEITSNNNSETLPKEEPSNIEPEEKKEPPKLITKPQQNKFYAMCKGAEFSDSDIAEFKTWLKAHNEIETHEDQFTIAGTKHMFDHWEPLKSDFIESKMS